MYTSVSNIKENTNAQVQKYKVPKRPNMCYIRAIWRSVLNTIFATEKGKKNQEEKYKLQDCGAVTNQFYSHLPPRRANVTLLTLLHRRGKKVTRKITQICPSGRAFILQNSSEIVQNFSPSIAILVAVADFQRWKADQKVCSCEVKIQMWLTVKHLQAIPAAGSYLSNMYNIKLPTNW